MHVEISFLPSGVGDQVQEYCYLKHGDDNKIVIEKKDIQKKQIILSRKIAFSKKTEVVNFCFNKSKEGHKNKVCLAMSDFSLMVLDFSSLDILSIIKKPFITKNSYIKDILLLNSTDVFIAGDCGKIVKWKFHDKESKKLKQQSKSFIKKECTESLEISKNDHPVDNIKPSNEYNSLQLNWESLIIESFFCPPEPIYFFGFEDEKDICDDTPMYIATISGLMYYKPKNVHKDSFFEISMGKSTYKENKISSVIYNSLAISCIASKTIQGKLKQYPCSVAADLSGKVIVFVYQTEDPGYRILGVLNVFSSVRALSILDQGDGEALCMFGTLEGKLGGFKFNVNSGFVDDSPSIKLTGLGSGILALKWMTFPDLGKSRRECQFSRKGRKPIIIILIYLTNNL